MTGYDTTAGPTDGGLTEMAPGSMDLAHAVRDALARTGYGWLRQVVVEAAVGRVVLRGTVPSFYLKQLAQVTVMAVPGVELVRNELRVGLNP